jgi:ubiquinone/menaquinone biosynthesis C-methylase UbiE
MVKHGFSKDLNKDYALILKAWPYEKELYTNLALQARKFNGRSLIEFGCGSGEATIHLHKLNPNLKIFATDIDPKVIQNAKNHIKSANVKFAVADVFKFKTDKRYDIVSSSHVIHNFARKKQEKILKTMFKVLKSKGYFITMEKILPDDPIKRERLWQRQIDRFKIYDEYKRPDLKIAMLAHEAADKSLDSILIETPFRKMLERTGFHDVKMVFRRDRDTVLTARK